MDKQSRTYYDFAFKVAIDCFADELVTLCLEEAKRQKLIKKYPKIKVMEKIDTELIIGEKREADTILKLYNKTTTFIHIEYEVNPNKQFNERMWHYYRKIKNKYEIEGNIPILPIVIVIDGSTRCKFQEAVFGFEVLDFKFIGINIKEKAFFKLIQKNYSNPTTSLFLLLSFIVREKITKRVDELDDLIITSYKILEGYKRDEAQYLSLKNDFWNSISNILVSKLGYTIKYIDDLVRDKGGVEMTFSEKILEKGREEGEKIGIEKGERKKAIETAKKMKHEGLDIQLISKVTGLTIEEVAKL